MIRPEKLKPGDKVAAISLSWGGPAKFPHRYLAGKQQFEKEFGLKVEEMPNALRDPEWLAAHPEARAADLHRAFSDPAYKAVVSTIGGDDSIRLLPFIDIELIRQNPKIFLGYSDTTVSHFVLYRAGLVSFYGPSFMAGFGENGGIHPYLAASIRANLFSTEPHFLDPNPDGWTDEHLDWADPKNQQKRRRLSPPMPWSWLQGDGVVEGHLLGGCLEVLDWLRGTSCWPSLDEWRGAIIFVETSEEGPPPTAVQRFFRCLGAQGILQECAAVLFGRPGGNIPVEGFPEYDEAIIGVIRNELGRGDIPVVTHLDFGHTDPMMTLPLGVKARVDCTNRRIALLESGVSEG